MGGALAQISYNVSSSPGAPLRGDKLAGRVPLVERSALLRVLAKGFVDSLDRFFYDVPSEWERVRFGIYSP